MSVTSWENATASSVTEEVDYLADGSETITKVWYDDNGQLKAETADGEVVNGGFKFANSMISGVSVSSNGSSGSGYTYTAGTGTWQTQASTATSGKLTLLGDDADLVINGRSLNDTLTKLEERLNILNVNEKLESEWAELRELGDRYREMESRIKSKMKLLDKLKRYDRD